MSNTIKLLRINTKKGPEAIGPYSTATVHRGVMYVSGQLGIDPTTGELVGKDVEAQAKKAMDNLKVFLDEVKVDMNCIIKTTVYLKVILCPCRICLISGKSMPSMGPTSQISPSLPE